MRREATTLALGRAAHRHGEEGAAMFIVAMTTAVLASVGVFALAAAATEVRSAGNERQATQTHFLAQYGIVAAAQDLSTFGKPSLYYTMMQSQTMATNERDTCKLSLPGVDSTSNLDWLQKACKALEPGDVSTSWNGAGSGPPPPALIPYDGGAPYQGPAGTLGPIPMTGGFRVELTDPTKYPPPAGYGFNTNICFYGYTMSAMGETAPDYGTNTAAAYAGRGTEIQRARITAGPDRCP
jgi:hypothetical protein